MTEQYHSIAIGIIILLSYLITWFLARSKVISIVTHRKIWNSFLAIFFLGSAILGLIMAVSIDQKVTFSWYSQTLWFHVVFGVAMTVIALFHLAWHIRYYIQVLRGASKAVPLAKYSLVSLPIIVLALIVFAKSNNNQQTTIDDGVNTQVNENQENDVVSTNTSIIKTTPEIDGGWTDLKVTSSCIGCGKCTRLDPEHFSISSATRKATVISEDNLDSSRLDNAISSCPASAILRS